MKQFFYLYSLRKSVCVTKKGKGYGNQSAQCLVGIVAVHHGIIGWEDDLGQELLRKCSGENTAAPYKFSKILGIPPHSEREIERWEHKESCRPQDCDTDHLYGRMELWMNGIFFIAIAGHRENSVRSKVRQVAKDWLFLWGSKKYNGGNE